MSDAPRERLMAELADEVKDKRVLDAIRRVPREEFVDRDVRHAAYENRPLPIGHGQTISQPLIVALMAQALLLTGDEKMLEVGTGSGYQAAVLSLLARQVVSVERVAPLAQAAAERLERLGYRNVEVHVVEEVLGWPDGAPYDGIVVAAAAPEVPLALLNQLAAGGRLVIPVGARNLQELVRIVKTPAGAQRHNLGPCRFVPLLGSSAWPERRR
ncbi:MAG TPA: protein-L-isoaspartate(D-aspartate) O-methyltransferase [Dehalococcoidia bacterium]|jgi:protein-L-isoaspartate(D-aspartate) O-methyltransferase